MGMKTIPDFKTVDEVFKDLDEDNTNENNREEFSRFLRRLFIS
jgi:hypothetical protein